MASPPEPRFRTTRFRKPFWLKGGFDPAVVAPARPPWASDSVWGISSRGCGACVRRARSVLVRVGCPWGLGLRSALPRFCGSGPFGLGCLGALRARGPVLVGRVFGTLSLPPASEKNARGSHVGSAGLVRAVWFGRVGRAPRGPCRVGTCVWAGQGPRALGLVGGCSAAVRVQPGAARASWCPFSGGCAWAFVRSTTMGRRTD